MFRLTLTLTLTLLAVAWCPSCSPAAASPAPQATSPAATSSSPVDLGAMWIAETAEAEPGFPFQLLPTANDGEDESGIL